MNSLEIGIEKRARQQSIVFWSMVSGISLVFIAWFTSGRWNEGIFSPVPGLVRNELIGGILLIVGATIYRVWWATHTVHWSRIKWSVDFRLYLRVIFWAAVISVALPIVTSGHAVWFYGTRIEMLIVATVVAVAIPQPRRWRRWCRRWQVTSGE